MAEVLPSATPKQSEAEIILMAIVDSLDDISVATLQKGSPNPVHNKRMAEEEGMCHEGATYAPTKRSHVQAALATAKLSENTLDETIVVKKEVEEQ